ncbi:MAG: hypothetical protein HS126_34340 [Anaerolineales bacterium]|nr:hypothetical protein [Anaerolineales bacterium]
MVELDVHTSSDRVPVIIHDANLSRTTNGTGEVSKYTLSELKKLDAGEGQTIPTLAEAIACCREHELGLYLELKSSRAIPAISELVRQHNLYRQTIVTSFRPDWLADVRALDPDIVTRVLFSSVPINPVALAHAAGAQYVHPAWEQHAAEPHRLLTPEWISRVQAAGLGLIAGMKSARPRLPGSINWGWMGSAATPPTCS